MFTIRAITILAIVFGLCVNIHCKIYDRCEFAKELRDVHEIPDNQLATWVCIARHESDYNTSAINHGSGDHGLFQISQLFWCSPPGYACGVSCNDMRNDDIEDDVICARRVYREHKRLSGDGFNAWVVYGLYCRDKQYANTFLDGCFTHGLKTSSNDEEKPLPTVNYYPDFTKTTTTSRITTTTTTKRTTTSTTAPTTTLLNLKKITPTTRKIAITAKSFITKKPSTGTTRKVAITTPTKLRYSRKTTNKLPVVTVTAASTKKSAARIEGTTVKPASTTTKKPVTPAAILTTKKANGGVQLHSSKGKPLIPTEENDEFVYAISRTGYKFTRF